MPNDLFPQTTPELAVAVAHVTQCPNCIHGHTSAALRHGATGQEIKEAIWVAAEMRARGAYAHSVIALDTIDQVTSSFEGTTELPLSSSSMASQPPLSGVLYDHPQ
jgi:AhpD family alkylhydroperoxidase